MSLSDATPAMSLNGVQPQDREKLPWSSNLIQTLTMDAIIRRW